MCDEPTKKKSPPQTKTKLSSMMNLVKTIEAPAIRREVAHKCTEVKWKRSNESNAQHALFFVFFLNETVRFIGIE